MSIDAARLRTHLDNFNFRDLFIEELGWSNPLDRKKTSLEINGAQFERVQIAQLSGVVVFEITAKDGAIPDAKTRRAIHTEISRSYHENLLLFIDGKRAQSLWYWVKRETGKTYPREHLFTRGQPADLILSKITAMVFDISEFDESGNVPVVEVANRLKKALDVERVTKKFYKEFQEQHLKFLDLIEGIADERDRRWYASVLLNRLMFIYFLQSKFFLFIGQTSNPPQDRLYLQEKLSASKSAGKNRYYAGFLKKLFFIGFAKPDDDEEKKAEKSLLGNIPYLNGGLFLPHRIEVENPNIKIPDLAFENLFQLFASYSWNLDDTPGGQADEINPDVLGYIFEKYINQKAFGAYYTRPEITQYLCEQTIYKLVLERINELAPPLKRPETSHLFPQERTTFFNERRYDSMPDLLMNLDAFLCRRLFHEWLPELRLLDPACGSGAFLVAAMKTLINIYSAVIGKIEFVGDNDLKREIKRLREEHHGSLNYYIKKRIITDNLFGVDVMEEATEIARLRLFLTLVASAKTRDQLEPLPNIDFNILAGNSLIGLLRIDAKEFDKHFSEKEPLLRKGYRDFVRETANDIRVYRQASSFTDDLRFLRDNIEEKKKEVYATLNEILLDQFATDLGIKFEQATWDEKKNEGGKPIKRKLTLKDIENLHPFHWGFEFDEVINKNGGFDAIITNPPWEIFKPNDKEFLSQYSDLVTKKKMDIKALEKEKAKMMRDPEIAVAYTEYLSTFPHVSAYFRAASQYVNQISTVNGKKAGSDINLYKLFLEQSFNLLRPTGRCGIILQSGIYTDLGAKQLREMLFSNSQLDSLFGFSNEKFIFENVHHAQKFCILVFEKGGHTISFQAAFRINPREAVVPDRLDEFLNSKDEHIEMSVPLVRRLSPDSLSIMEFKRNIDVGIVERMLRFPLLGEKIEGAWNLSLTREFDMTNDSALFKTSPSAKRLELYEGKMIHQFNHRLVEPRYWVDEKEGRSALLKRNEIDQGQMLDYQSYRFGFRDVAASTNERTMIAAVVPPNIFSGNTLILSQGFQGLSNMIALVALLNSYCVDFIIRKKVTNHCNMFYVYQLPIPRLTEKDSAFAPIVERAAKLICTTPEFDELAREVGLGSHKKGASNEAERARLRAELDGLIAHLYGLTEDEFAYILTSFPLVSETVKTAAQNAYRDVERGLIK